MKKIILLIIVAILFSCEADKKGCTDPDAINYDSDAEINDFSCEYKQAECISSDWPPAPHGTADDVTTYVNGDYRSIDYTYYCLDKKYVSITYTQFDKCEKWEKSEYTSNGICDK